MPGTRATRSSLNAGLQEPALFEQRAHTAAQRRSPADTQAGSRRQAGRVAKRKAAEVTDALQHDGHDLASVADSSLSSIVETRSTRSAASKNASGKKPVSRLQTVSPQQRGTSEHAGPVPRLGGGPMPAQQQPKAGQHADTQQSETQHSAAGAVSQHDKGAEPANSNSCKVDDPHSKRRKTSIETRAPGKQLSAPKASNKSNGAQVALPDAQQQGPPNKRRRTASTSQNGRAQQAKASSHAKSSCDDDSLPAHAQTNAQPELQPAQAAANAASDSKQGAGKHHKAAAAKRSSALPPKAPAKPPNGKSRTTTRRATRSKPTEAEVGSKQHATEQQTSEPAAPSARDSEQASEGHHDLHSSARPLPAAVRETHALASKVLQQTLGAGPGTKAASLPKPLDEARQKTLDGESQQSPFILSSLQSTSVSCVQCYVCQRPQSYHVAQSFQ